MNILARKAYLGSRRKRPRLDKCRIVWMMCIMIIATCLLSLQVQCSETEDTAGSKNAETQEQPCSLPARLTSEEMLAYFQNALMGKPLSTVDKLPIMITERRIVVSTSAMTEEDAEAKINSMMSQENLDTSGKGKQYIYTLEKPIVGTLILEVQEGLVTKINFSKSSVKSKSIKIDLNE